MPIQIEFIGPLLGALDGREGQGENYAVRNFLVTLMRYFLLPVPRLAFRQREAAVAGGLVALHRRRHLLAPRRLRARPGAVAITAVAATAEEEHLAATAADDEAKGVHAGGEPAMNWTSRLARATTSSSSTRARVGRHEG